ncbi:unnamed protein product [Prorocentrum cordatum]|uniref:Uncharacterized protein n=1 Tax=Prorocentrum cordatum TaxID=2364126 RepID=A0ABN9SG99_9DINO|nr:unnamed protein product [Polarella glacialis]
MWDAAVFIGCPQVGAPSSAVTAAALLLNAAMQVIFCPSCIIVNDSLTRPRIDESTVSDFKDWRTTVAHNLKYVDDLTFRSLARKVCSFEDTPMAAGPIQGLEAISEYQPSLGDREHRSDPPLGYWWPSRSVGEVMCLLSLVLWWLTVLKEIFSMVSLSEALRSVPTAVQTEISSTAGRLALVSMSRCRKATVVGVLLVRSFVCLVLAICGTLYLASTISLGDLLLNALALEVVLSLDELTFEVLAPRSIRLLISSMAPLAKPASPAWRGLDGRPVVASAAIAVGLSLVYGLILREQSQVLMDAREAICGGNLDFIASVDQNGMVVAFSGGSTGDHTDWYEYQAFRSLILNASELYADVHQGSSSKLAYAFTGSRFSLEGMAHQTLEELGEVFNPVCYDYSETLTSSFTLRTSSPPRSPSRSNTTAHSRRPGPPWGLSALARTSSRCAARSPRLASAPGSTARLPAAATTPPRRSRSPTRRRAAPRAARRPSGTFP